MEANTAFVRTDCAVELNTITAVNVDFTGIVCPRYTEHNNSFRLNNAFENCILLDFRHLFYYRFKSFKNFFNCLQKFRFIGILSLYLIKDAFNVCVFHIASKCGAGCSLKRRLPHIAHHIRKYRLAAA